MSIIATATPTLERPLPFDVVTPRISDTTRARRFVWVSVLTYITGLGTLAAFSIYTNPWGNFGSVGLFDPSEYNDRLVKANYLDSLRVEERPQILVLGSSSMMCFRPEDIAAKSGKTVFNNYVSGGQVDDHLCLLKHMVEDLNYRPDWLVIGVETWTFAPHSDENGMIPGVRRALVNVPQWIRHHPYGSWYRRLWSKTVDCFSREHLKAGWSAFFREQRERHSWKPLGNGILASDGTFPRLANDSMKLGGRDFTLSELRREGVSSILERIFKEGQADTLERLRFYQFDGLSPPRVERFAELLRLCKHEKIKVLLVNTPLHPLAWQMLKNHPEHARNVAQLEAMLARWAGEFPETVRVFDASHIESFEGDQEDFYDEMHCGPENSRRIICRITPVLNAP